MNNHKNYYELLHVQPDAPTEVIRSSYRALMQKLKMHPDLGGDQQEAALVNEAYAILTDPAARQKYDASLAFVHAAEQANCNATENKKSACADSSDLANTDQCLFCNTLHAPGISLQVDSTCTTCESALFPAAKQAFEQRDQRIIQRINRQWDVTFYTQWPSTRAYSGKTHDVSLHGMQLLTNVALEGNQLIKITSGALDAVARVVNLREERCGILSRRWRVGLEFLTLRFHRSQGAFLKIDA